MRRSFVKNGLKLIIAAVVLVILTTFYHEQVALFARLSSTAETRLVFFGLFAGGLCGCLGILVTVSGILRDPAGREEVLLAPTIIILAGAILLFFFLVYFSFHSPEPPERRPGETITI